MHTQSRVALVGLAYGLALAGQIALLPVATADGDTLTRIAAHLSAWQAGHQLLAAGAALLIPSSLVLYLALRSSAPRLAALGLGLQLVGLTALIGQYALDFAWLELARATSREWAVPVASSLRTNPAVVMLYFKLADGFMLGSICFALAALRDPGLRWRTGVVTTLGIVFMIGSELGSPVALRIGLGLLGLGFALVPLGAGAVAGTTMKPQAT